jgi:hypothetical protein
VVEVLVMKIIKTKVTAKKRALSSDFKFEEFQEIQHYMDPDAAELLVQILQKEHPDVLAQILQNKEEE